MCNIDFPIEKDILFQITENIPIPIAYINKDKIHEYANINYCTLIGLTQDKIVSQHLDVIVENNIYASLKANIPTALKGDVVSIQKTAPEHKGGNSQVTILLVPRVITTDDTETTEGVIVYIYNPDMLYDNSTEQLFKIIMNSSDHGIAIIDSDLRITSWNRKFLEMGICSREFLLGNHKVVDLYEMLAERGLLGEGDKKKLIDRQMRIVENRQYNEQLINTDGGLVKVKRYFLNNGGMCAVFKHMEAQQSDLEHSKHIKKLTTLGMFIGYFAHDIGNLIQIILGSLDNMKIPKNSKNREYYDRISYASLEAKEITRSLLNFVRNKPIDVAPLDINSIIEEMEIIIKHSVGKKIEVALELNDLPLVNVDQNQLQAALLNLCINSKDAIKNHGRISIKTYREHSTHKTVSNISSEEFAVIKVTDNGRGMDPETLQSAIKPFFTTKTDDGGTGLGLSSVYGFAKESGGDMAIESTPDEGTSIYLYLPIIINNQLPLATDGTGQRALVVEHDKPIAEMITKVLEKQGYNTDTAVKGSGAMELLQKNRYNLVVSDVLLDDDTNGYEIANRATELHRGIRVVLISSVVDESDFAAQSSIKNANICFLPKPFTSDELLKRI